MFRFVARFGQLLSEGILRHEATLKLGHASFYFDTQILQEQKRVVRGTLATTAAPSARAPTRIQQEHARPIAKGGGTPIESILTVNLFSNFTLPL